MRQSKLLVITYVADVKRQLWLKR